jgi:hypothetical protein
MLIVNDQLQQHLDSWEESFTDDYNLSNSKNTKENDDNCHQVSRIDNSISLMTKWILNKFSVLLMAFFFGLKVTQQVHDFEEAIPNYNSLGLVLIGIWIAWSANFLISIVTKNVPTIRSSRVKTELFQILLSMGAISIDIDVQSIVFQDSCKELISTSILSAAMCFRRFLQTIDMSLERIKAATSMKLGLGIWSPAIYRVDMNSRLGITLPLQRAIIAQGLQACISLLTNESEFESSETYSLTWLQMARRKLPSAFFTYLSQPMITHKELQVMEQKLTTLQQTLDAVILQLPKLDTSHPLYLVAQHLHAAEIALWSSFNDSNNQDEWLERFQSLVKVAGGRLGQTMTATTTTQPRENEESMSDQLNLASKITSADRIISYMDDDTDDVSKATSINVVPDKTMIFYGTGRNENQVPSNSSTSHGTLTSYPLCSKTIPGNLLEELQEKLASLPNVVEELNTPELQHDVDDTKPCNLRTTHPPQCNDITHFLSNELFQELQSSIQSRNMQ